ncbi:hypothetical protein [Dyella sp.]|uniref:hypothetical protein n=1 Tax=Dyella sp. TaxID=1869338 RepID=UPI002ED425BC
MRWILLITTLFAFVVCFTRHSGGAMAFWLLLAVVGLLVTTLAFVQARINGSARDDSALSAHDVERLKAGKPPWKHDRGV